MAYQNLAEMFFRRAAELAERPRYLAKREGKWRETTWREHERAVREIAGGLIALGLRPGARVAILANTRPEWMEIDFAALAIGTVTIPIYASNLPDECGYILWNSESSICFVENPQQLAKIRQVLRDGFDLDGVAQTISLGGVIMIEGEADGALPLAELRGRGRAALEKGAAEEMESRVRAIARDDLATIVYTSGTTGPPKGVPQTHGNHLVVMEALARAGLGAEGDVDFAFLPLAHSFGRANAYFATYAGWTTAFAQRIDTIPDDIRETRPHLVPSVPRIFEKIYGRVQGMRNAAPPLKRRLFDWSVVVGLAKSRAQQEGKPLSPWLAMRAALADRLVFARIRELLGGRVKYMISGGAPLAREIQEFFHAAGLLVLEGYGLTETTPSLTMNRPDAYRFGTVGKPLDCVTLRIADDGEILAKGPNVAGGYYKREEATREAWDEEGWFHTGDIGELTPDGFLRITDRKKDLLKTSGGKYVAPQKVENLLKTQPHVSQAVLVGDNRKYCVALLTLDPDEIGRWAAAQSIPETGEALAEHPKVRELVESQVAAVNRRLASYESVKYFRILPRDFSQDTGELTPSLKVKRKFVNQKYAAVIEEMYGER